MTAFQSVDPKAFRAFEHAGWQNVASLYHKSFAHLTVQVVGSLLDAVEIRKGSRVLDVATGPGYVARAAADRGASSVGLDFSAAMVAEARGRFPDLEFREGDAEDLPFPEGSFDAVVTNFGLLHFARPEQAIAEAHRVLRTGGRIGFTVWAKPEEAIGFGIVLRAIQAHGDLNVPLPPGPPFFRFSDHQECRRALDEAGFVMLNVIQVDQVWQLSSGEALFEAMQGSTVRTAGLLRAQSKEALNAIRKALLKEVEAYRKDRLIEIPMPAVLASAVKR